MKMTLIRNVALSLAVVLAVSGCAQKGGLISSSGDSEQVCNPIVLAGIAALTCGLLSRGKDRGKNAAVCAAAAGIGCYLANSYKVEQVRSQKQVEAEYRRRGKSVPTATTIDRYAVQVTPDRGVKRGQNLTYLADIIVFQSSSDTGSLIVEEEVQLYDSLGKSFGTPVRKTAVQKGGQFNTKFTVPIDTAMEEGQYTLKRALYLNGKKAAQGETGFQVVARDSDLKLASLDKNAR